jgi:predicted nucleic acid-binding protein
VVVVDTSVWVDYFNGVNTLPVNRLDRLLGERSIGLGDLVLAELMQGFATEADARAAYAYLEPFEFVEMAGREIALESAANFRRLRRRGATVRKTIDMLIGTYCLVHDHELLHSDRDFDVMARHLGLKTVVF